MASWLPSKFVLFWKPFLATNISQPQNNTWWLALHFHKKISYLCAKHWTNRIWMNDPVTQTKGSKKIRFWKKCWFSTKKYNNTPKSVTNFVSFWSEVSGLSGTVNSTASYKGVAVFSSPESALCSTSAQPFFFRNTAIKSQKGCWFHRITSQYHILNPPFNPTPHQHFPPLTTFLFKNSNKSPGFLLPGNH